MEFFFLRGGHIISQCFPIVMIESVALLGADFAYFWPEDSDGEIGAFSPAA